MLRCAGLGLCFCLILSGCQVYRNSGRSSFESAAPAQVVSTTTTQSIHEALLASSQAKSVAQKSEKDSDCWVQPAFEPLWFQFDQQELTVKPLSSETIEVCTSQTAEDSNEFL